MTADKHYSLVKRILLLFAVLVLLLFVIIFIFAYHTTRSEYEQKVYYKIERVGMLLERQLRNSNVQSFSGKYKLGEINTTIQFYRKRCDEASLKAASLSTLQQEACEQIAGFVIEPIKNDHLDTYYLNSRNNLVIQVSVLHSDINRYVLKLTSKILLPYLIISPIAILVIFLFLIRMLRPLGLLEQEILSRAPNQFDRLHTEPKAKELDSLVTALNQMFQKIRDFQFQQQQFIANAAHELRTPLTALSLHLQIIKNEFSDSAQHVSMFTQFEERLQRLQLLVNQMMALAHQEKPASDTPAVAIDLSVILKQCIEQLYPTIEKKSLNLYITDFENSLMHAHPDQLNSIVINLLDNAIKYTPDHGLINISLKNQFQHICLIIEDSGPGLDESEYKNVFQRFYRLPDTQHIIGSGLGLSIVAQAVQQLHGKIELSRSLLGGLTVTLEFPKSVKPLTYKT